MTRSGGLPRKARIRAILFLPAMGVFIFVNAGTLRYWRGWAYLAVSGLLLVTTVLALRSRADLVKERLKPGPGMRKWDKAFMALYVPLTFAVPLIAPLDVVRYGWSEPLPALVSVLGMILYAAASLLVNWAMRVNNFFSSVVRLQSDRGQTVVSSGPYSVVRHPGYVAGSLLFIGSALLLGSRWALACAGAIALLFIIRTALEDAMLRRELEGYAEYSQRVRYRLLPGVW